MPRPPHDPTALPIRSILADRSEDLDQQLEPWLAAVPVVRQVLEEGLELGALNVFVGENGAGKSTLVEAIALAFGMSAEGGSTGARHSSRPTESRLHHHLRLRRGTGSRWGFFLRAESMHGFFTYLEQNPTSKGSDPKFHEMSHGESFLTLLASRFGSPGLFVLDEPEAALSFQSSLALIDVLQEVAARPKSQVIVSTHSPLVAAIPGAQIFEIGEFGIRRVEWDELELVRHWKRFLTAPESYLRHLSHVD